MTTTINYGITEVAEGSLQQTVVVNTALEKIDKALASYFTKSVAGSSNVTLTATEWENPQFEFTGTLTGNISVIVPNKPRIFLVYNNTSGAFTLTVRTSAGTGMAVTQLSRLILMCDGTDVHGIGVAGSFTTEDAQDAVGAMIDSSLVYVDATPLLTRAAITGDVSISQGSNSSTVVSASDTTAGKVELATITETSTGTDATRAVTPDGLSGSIFGTFIVSIAVSDPNGAVLTTGDGKAYWFVPTEIDGMNLVSVSMGVTTQSTSGIPTVQIANVTKGADMLSTKLTVDANETHSKTAATAAVIDTAHDDVSYGDLLRFDVDVAGTGTKGVIVTCGFRLP